MNTREQGSFLGDPAREPRWAVDGQGLLATVGRPQAFHNGRHLAAWLGLVPRPYSSGGKERLWLGYRRGDRSSTSQCDADV